MEDILIRKQYFCRDTKLRLPTKEVMSELPFSIQDFDNFVDWIGREVIHNTSFFKDPHGVIRKTINDLIAMASSSDIWDQTLFNTKSSDERVSKIKNFQQRLLRIQLLREFSNNQNSAEDNKRYGDFDRLLYMMSTGMEFNLEIYDLKWV